MGKEKSPWLSTCPSVVHRIEFCFPQPRPKRHGEEVTLFPCSRLPLVAGLLVLLVLPGLCGPRQLMSVAQAVEARSLAPSTVLLTGVAAAQSEPLEPASVPELGTPPSPPLIPGLILADSGRPFSWSPRSLLSQPAEPDPRFSWPLSPAPQVTRPFQRPETDYGAGHRGVDLAAAPSQQVLAAGPGVVVFSGQVAGQGVVSIDHDGGLRTTYEPITPMVPAGTQVFAGQPIGTVNPGHPGCPVAVCLHWGVRRGEEYLNPLALIRTESVIRLKPWDPP